MGDSPPDPPPPRSDATASVGRVLAPALALAVILLLGTLIAATSLDREPQMILLLTQSASWLASLFLSALSITLIAFLAVRAVRGQSISGLAAAASLAVLATLAVSGHASSWTALAFALVAAAGLIAPLLERRR